MAGPCLSQTCHWGGGPPIRRGVLFTLLSELGIYPMPSPWKESIGFLDGGKSVALGSGSGGKQAEN